MNHKALIKKFDKQAEKYNRQRGKDGAYKYRRRIFPQAKGQVLEVGIGAGLNFPFYDQDVELTGVDFSGEMLKFAKHAAQQYPFKASFIEADVESLEVGENAFDTIVSSGTLCAYKNPGGVLKSFQKWCRPDGTILLLEHGISTNRQLAGLQKAVDPLLLKTTGCHWDRDISGMVKSAGLKVVREERYLAGNVYLIWALP